MLVKHKAEVISMVLTSFNQKAYEKDLYEEGVEDGLDLGRTQMARSCSVLLSRICIKSSQVALA